MMDHDDGFEHKFDDSNIEEEVDDFRQSLLFNRQTRGQSLAVADHILRSAKSLKIPSREDIRKNDIVIARDRRRQALDELIQTEDSYNKILKQLYEHFMLGLQAHLFIKNAHDVLKKDEIEAIFMNLPELIQLSDVILARFRDSKNSMYPFETLTDVFVEKTSHFRMYERYTSDYAAAFNLVRNLQKYVAPFKSFVRIREFCVKKKLDQLMSTPIQRIPRYLLLLNEMYSNSYGLEDHVILGLKKAIDDLIHLTQEIDDNISRGAAKNEVAFLQEGFFGGKVNLVTSTRYCVRYGVLTKINNKKAVLRSNFKHLLFILFDDCMCYASISSDGSRGKLKHAIPLYGLQVVPIEAGNREQLSSTSGDQVVLQLDNLLFVSYSEKSFMISCPTLESRDEWLKDITTHIELLELRYAETNKEPPNAIELERAIISTDKTHQLGGLKRSRSISEMSRSGAVDPRGSALLSEGHRQRLLEVLAEL